MGAWDSEGEGDRSRWYRVHFDMLSAVFRAALSGYRYRLSRAWRNPHIAFHGIIVRFAGFRQARASAVIPISLRIFNMARPVFAAVQSRNVPCPPRADLWPRY